MFLKLCAACLAFVLPVSGLESVAISAEGSVIRNRRVTTWTPKEGSVVRKAATYQAPTSAFYIEQTNLGSKSCEHWQSNGDGQQNVGGTVTLAQCKKACDDRAGCQYITWYENNGCRTYTSCEDPVDDVPQVVKHIYAKQAPTTTTTWSESSTMTSCTGSSFQSPWTGTEGGLTSAGSNTMRLHKAYCPKVDGIDVSVEQAVPSGTDAIGLSFGVVQIGGDGCSQCHNGDAWSSPLWVTLVDSQDTSKFFRWCFNRRSWGSCDETEEVSAGQWHAKEFSVSKFEQKFGHTNMTLRLGVYADQRTGTTLVRDVTFKKAAACDVTVYQHWPEGIAVSMLSAASPALHASITSWNGNFPTGLKESFHGTGIYGLASTANQVSSVKVSSPSGACCQVSGYTDDRCTAAVSNMTAIQSNVHYEYPLSAGVVASGRSLKLKWGCHDCARCIKVEQC